MTKGQPRRINFTEFREMVERLNDQIHWKPAIGNGYAVAINAAIGLRNLFGNGEPFRPDDMRIGIITAGEADVLINLMPHHYSPGTLVYISSESIIQAAKISQDLQLTGITIANDTLKTITRGSIPPALGPHTPHFLMELTAEQLGMATGMLRMIHALATTTPDAQDAIYDLIASFLRYYDYICTRAKNASEPHRSREQDIFNRFIALVNQAEGRERRLAYYADKLCLSQRHLGTVVKQASGVTAKEWIDRATITEIKVLLKHTNLQVSQIADRLHFPNNAFFCKYFKRLTNLTPNEYKNN